MSATPIVVGFETGIEIVGHQTRTSPVDNPGLNLGRNARPVTINALSNIALRCSPGTQLTFTEDAGGGFDVDSWFIHRAYNAR